MSQLTFSSVPGFNDIADSAIAGNQPLTDDSLLKISHNAKFAAVRCECIFMGYYGAGDTVPTPTSPVDGYAYSRAECSFIWMIYTNRSRAEPYTPGQQYPPPISDSQPQNGLYNFPGGWDINDLTGVITLRTSYYSGGGAEVVNTDGVIKVFCIAQRSSVSVAD
jgi:hypothetical protein